MDCAVLCGKLHFAVGYFNLLPMMPATLNQLIALLNPGGTGVVHDQDVAVLARLVLHQQEPAYFGPRRVD